VTATYADLTAAQGFPVLLLRAPACLATSELANCSNDFHCKRATDAATIIPQSTIERFECLFERISKLHIGNMRRNSEPFR
jgi:hypothetical protein